MFRFLALFFKREQYLRGFLQIFFIYEKVEKLKKFPHLRARPNTICYEAILL